jgi:adenosylmethionine-8-amino-7-oxononanoate aminotransferase
VGAAVGLAVLDRIREMRLVDRARTRGERLLTCLSGALAENPIVGDIRGLGLLICVELVEDPDTMTPFPRSARMTEKVIDRAMELGLLLYPSTGNVDGENGDYLLIGPPLTILDDEVDLIVDRVVQAMEVTR